MVRKILMILTIFLATAAVLNAQTGELKGKVVDGDGLPLIGANVVVKGTTNGTITNVDGEYLIQSIPVGEQTIVSSFIGFSNVEQNVNIIEGQTATLNFTLIEDITSLEELVVIGYGTVKKDDATGSVSVVSTKDFNRGNITSPQELLVGKSAGVSIVTSGGAPGSGSTIRIRGGSSLNASNDPLVIIDGVPISTKDVSGSSNFLAMINPNDIETFTVLKDASATAIYGSRASNGVILITTKKGKDGSPMKINYNGSVTVSTPANLLDVYSGDEIRKYAFEKKELYNNQTYYDLGSENTNWQKEIFRTSVSHDHNIGLSGSYDFLPYRVSIGYTDQVGILKNTDMQRLTGAVNLNPSFLDNTLKVNVNAKGMSSKNNFGDDGAVGSAISMDPTQPVKDGNANSDGYYQWENYGANLGTPNPVEQALAVDNTATVNRFIGNAQVDYSLPFLPDLHANLNLATDVTKSEGVNNRPVTSPSTLTNPLNGKLNDYTAKNTNKLLDFYLNYKKDLTAISSSVDVTAGYSWQNFTYETTSYTRGIVDAENPYQMTDSSETFNELQLVSFFQRVNYSLLDKYLFTFTMRQDGSSRFAEGNRWGLFPAAALAWKISDEPFLENVSVLSDLKMRLGWGVTGQQDIGDSFYPYMARYQQSAQGFYYFFDGDYVPTLRPAAYNGNITWEETTTQNIGFDFGFLEGRYSGSIDMYKRVTDELLNNVVIPTGSNFSNRLDANVGSMENTGVELALNLKPISTKDQTLNVSFNLTYNKQKITKLLLTDDPDYIGILYGDNFGGTRQVTRVDYPAYSFFLNEQIYDALGNPIEGLYNDLSGMGGTVSGDNNDRYIYESPNPQYLLGLSLRYNYKQFDIAASSRASIGNYVYNAVAAGASFDQMYQIGYWKNMPTSLDKTEFVKRQFSSDYFVENASFLKLDNVSVGYNVDDLFNGVGARFSFTVQNVFTITKYSGLDPEVRYDNGRPGIDGNFYPRPRTFMLGVSLDI